MRNAILRLARAGAPLLLAACGLGDEPAGGDWTRGAHVVRRGALRITIEERGTLKTLQSARIRAQVPGKIATLVEEGTVVKQGDVLVTMDTTEVERQIEQLESQIIQLTAELKSAETEQRIQEAQNQTDIEKAKLALRVAKADIDKYVNSDVPNQERKHLIGIEEADVALERSEETLEASKQLLEEDFVTQTQHEENELKVKQARNQLETKRAEYEAWLEYEKPIELDKKQAAVTEAGSALERTIARAEAQMESRKAQTQQKRTALERTRNQLANEQEKLEQLTLTAPTDGTVLYGEADRPWDTENIKVGAQVWPNNTILTLPDPSDMAVNVDVHEADIGKLKKGMRAFIASQTQPDTIFEGEVHEIARVPNAGRRWGSDNVKRFSVEIRLLDAPATLRPGTSANVEIVVGEKEDVLTVPVQAIHARENRYFVYRLEEDGPAAVDVETGASNATWVSIRSGLSEGDRVLLYSPDTATRETSTGPEEGDEAEDAARTPTRSGGAGAPRGRRGT